MEDEIQTSDLHPLLDSAQSSADASSAVASTIAQETNHAAIASPHQNARLLLPYLYISHFLSRWGARMWEFGVGLFMFEIWPSSLLLTSLFGLVEDMAVVFLGVYVGKWVDRTARLKVVQVSLGVRNVSVLIAALALVILLLRPGSMLGGYRTFFSLVAVVNILGGVSALAALATNVAVERDWVLAIAEGKRLGTLTEMNSVMRRIDLSCKLLAPVLVGIIMSSLSVLAAAILISVWNVVSIGFEYYLLLSVYYKTPEIYERDMLSNKATDVVTDERAHGSTEFPGCGHEMNSFSKDSLEVEKEKTLEVSDTESLNPYSRQGIRTKLSQFCMSFCKRIWQLEFVEGWKVYARQEMLLPALALAMLYFTVLSFGYLMTAALKWKGVPAYILGLARGVSAVVGISATLAYPSVHVKLQTVRTGLWSSVIQWAFLSLCVASQWVPNWKISSALLMGGVAASRFGLWMFDLAVLQLMQESVPESERGTVGGVQNSVQSFFEMLSFVVGMLLPNPEDFDKLVFLSYGAVTMALLLYTIQVYRVRGHLIHMDCLFRCFPHFRPYMQMVQMNEKYPPQDSHTNLDMQL